MTRSQVVSEMTKVTLRERHLLSKAWFDSSVSLSQSSFYRFIILGGLEKCDGFRVPEYEFCWSFFRRS